jgi:DNA-binding response OmpR family regulator
MRILVLEDDELIGSEIKTYFELCDSSVELYEDGESLLEGAFLENFDIFLFDINTPKLNGLDTLTRIRQEGIRTPAIFITALSDIEFVKQGYAAGCDDYIRKPFNFEELELRIHKLLHKDRSTSVPISSEYRFDLTQMRLLHGETVIELKPQEKRLLYLLVKNRGQSVPPEVIKDYVWNDKDVCDNTLRTQIKKVREKLGDKLIKNIRNCGYKIEKYDQSI